MASKSNQKEDIKPELQKESSKSLNRIGFVVLVVIFSLALFLTYRALSQKSQNPSDDVVSPNGKITSPLTGSIINNNIVPISV